MKKRKGAISKIIALFTILAVVFTGCAANNKDKSNSFTNKSNTDKSVTSSKATNNSAIPTKIAGKKLKIMVVRKIGGDDHTAQFLAGTKAEGQSMGIQVDTFTANGDSTKFHDAINQALSKGYDGFIISHGDDKATVDDIQKIRAKGIPVVTFDSITDAAKIDGVTLTSQDDETLALLSLKQLVQDYSGKANIIYLWVDGFAPMVNRNRIYKLIKEKYTEIKEVERFGVASANTAADTQAAVAAMLAKHPKGTIDAIFAPWDAFAIGAARALKEAKRTEIKIYGIDVSNADLQEIQQKDSPWVATAAVDPKLIGQVDLRILLKKIAGEKTPKYYDLSAALINKDRIENAGTKVNMENLSKILSGWGQSTAFEEPWMGKLKNNK
ncbi:sugar ABC transporter substrate-binding protein [Clostridium oryzae]|uniref:D-ribose transporter subunit RbsB n=1 Tax=Clostridium oryzae TaxID=1450648 RepID=A0A1V4IX90_9CLOT|nr:sugar ABC transporter substrate-binding protein [Clostridium oryzae]OPJ64668.1 D-ribose transporter subunit RbsB [Clostridium oryzae]